MAETEHVAVITEAHRDTARALRRKMVYEAPVSPGEVYPDEWAVEQFAQVIADAQLAGKLEAARGLDKVLGQGQDERLWPPGEDRLVSIALLPARAAYAAQQQLLKDLSTEFHGFKEGRSPQARQIIEVIANRITEYPLQDPADLEVKVTEGGETA